MRLPPVLFLLVSAAGLVATAVPSAHAGALPVCNAKHKRPANPYGSVLSDGLKPALAANGPSSAATSMNTAPEASRAISGAAKPQQLSRAEWRASLEPCGSGRA